MSEFVNAPHLLQGGKQRKERENSKDHVDTFWNMVTWWNLDILDIRDGEHSPGGLCYGSHGPTRWSCSHTGQGTYGVCMRGAGSHILYVDGDKLNWTDPFCSDLYTDVCCSMLVKFEILVALGSMLRSLGTVTTQNLTGSELRSEFCPNMSNALRADSFGVPDECIMKLNFVRYRSIPYMFD